MALRLTFENRILIQFDLNKLQRLYILIIQYIRYIIYVPIRYFYKLNSPAGILLVGTNNIKCLLFSGIEHNFLYF